MYIGLPEIKFMEMAVLFSSETLVSVCESTRYHNPKDEN
jgi:hypothetical protein